MSSPSSAPPAEPDTSADRLSFLFALIVGDLHGSAVRIGAVAVMVSAAAADGNASAFRQIRHLAHDDSGAIRLALRFAAGGDLSSQVSERLDRLYADMHETVAQLKPFLRLDSLSPAHRDLLRRALPSLRRVALAASDAIQHVQPLYRGRIDGNFVHDAESIRAFLERAARGERADLGPNGVARLPALRQRRMSPRLALNRPCLLGLPGGDVDAILIDVSREGLGLRCESPVSTGQRVEVAFGARRLEASVTRVEGDLVGVRLARPLALSDPLFRGG